MTVIDDKYAQLRAGGLTLGDPTSPEGEAAYGGRFRHYQHGSIYWSALSGAHEVHGNIRAYWANRGWEWSWLGYPTTDEISRFGDAVRTSSFQWGTLYWDPEQPVEPFPLSPVQPAVLIVAHESFHAALRPLVDHKRATGMPTILVDRTRLGGYQGRDDAVRLKRAILEAHEALGVKFVLLVGDAHRLPARYRRTSHMPPPQDMYWGDAWYTAADLYYANLYLRHWAMEDGAVADRSSGFSTWDANADGAYDEHNWGLNDLLRFNPDMVDACPDVAVGRVPAWDAGEVGIYVDKVLRFERGEAVAPSPKLTVLIDQGYPSADSLSLRLVNDSRASNDYRVDYVGMDFGTTTPPSPFQTRPAPEVQNAAADSTFLVYVGHGATDAWDVFEGSQYIDGDRVRQYANAALPVVMSIGCSTGEWVFAAPDHGPNGEVSGQTPYLGEDGDQHRFWWTPASNPSRVWDTGGSAEATAPPIAEWTGQQGTVRVPIPKPAAYDLDRPSPTFGAAWLFNPNGGGVAFFGETTVAQNNWGTDLATGMFARWAGPGTKLGEMWLAGQQRYWKLRSAANDPDREDTIGAARSYLTYMTMLGDPSLRLRTDVRVDRWTDLGAANVWTDGPPVMVRNGDGCLEVFTRDRAGDMWWIRQTSPSNGWSDWQRLPTQVGRVAAFTAAVNGDGRPELFALGRGDLKMWHTWRWNTADASWSAWERFDGDRTFSVAPVVGNDSDGLLHLFARGSDGQLHRRRQTRSIFGITWTGWEAAAPHPTGRLDGDFAAVANADGRLEIITRGADRAFYTQWQLRSGNDGPWAATWARLSNGLFRGDPAAIRRPDGRLQVVGIGLDGRLWTLRQSAPSNGWEWSWAQLRSPVMLLRPALAVTAARTVSVTGLSASRTLLYADNADLASFIELGRDMSQAPAVIPNADGRLECVGVSSTHRVRHRWQIGRAWN